jgi:DNA gyrase subunit B
VLSYDGGVEAFVRHIDKSKQAVLSAPITIRGKRERVELELSLWWNDSYHETMLCFTNNIPQRDGGHPPGGLPRGADAGGGRYVEQTPRRTSRRSPARTRARA